MKTQVLSDEDANVDQNNDVAWSLVVLRVGRAACPNVYAAVS